MTVAQQANDLRVFPRAFVATSLFIFAYSVIVFVNWMTTYDWSVIESDVGIASLVGVPAVMLGAIGKFMGDMIQNYMK